MVENPDANKRFPEDDSQDNKIDYLQKAREANESGDPLLSMYLYLAAFEKSATESIVPTEDAVFGLKQAWALACSNKERSMAEYIFERMEPYLSSDEITNCADQLQQLALDKLEEFGLSRSELEGVAQMISEDLMADLDPIIKVEHIMTKKLKPKNGSDGADASSNADHELAADQQSSTETQEAGQTDEQEGGNDLVLAAEAEVQKAIVEEGELLNYDNIAGYASAVKVMRDFGIGMGNDTKFNELVGMLNARHGLSRMPALDSILFRSHAREDANRFMLATVGEIGLPTVQMRMEENVQGVPVLCISAQAAEMPTSNSFKDIFAKGGVLVLEDLDLWEAPVTEPSEETNPFVMMQLTRGAREAVNMIRAAVENPDVYVIATASIKGSIDEFFLSIMEPLTLIDIDYPTPEERVQIWMDIAKEHPSIRSISKADLVRYSANMARYDIYMAAREAVEEAYKHGLMTRKYQPVSRDNIFDKLAAYQPLESSEYGELEDEVIKDFQIDLNHIDDILKND